MEGPAANAKGEVFFNDVTSSKTYKIGLDGKVERIHCGFKEGQRTSVWPGRQALRSCDRRRRSWLTSRTGKATVIAEGFAGNDIVVAHNGNVYVTNPPADNVNDPSKVWLIKPNGEKTVVDTGMKYANGITLSPDPDAALRRRLPLALGLQLRHPAGRNASGQAALLLAPRAGHCRPEQRRRHSR